MGLSTFSENYKAGLRIAFDTDSGVSAHGQNAREFGSMIKAGMNPIDAIKSATVHAADNIGFGNHIGSVEPGKLADIIAVRRDPLADIDALLQVAFVMKDGSIHKFDDI